MLRIIMLSLLTILVGVQSGLADETPSAEALEQGKTIAFTRAKGNCLACHVITGGELAGNYGPPLLMMKTRFPDRADIRAHIWDASVGEPTTRMPPYGRHRILTEEEIDLLVDFIYSL
jgi:sulfur-oxidizing protein SoxX